MERQLHDKRIALQASGGCAVKVTCIIAPIGNNILSFANAARIFGARSAVFGVISRACGAMSCRFGAKTSTIVHYRALWGRLGKATTRPALR